ncbi:MAG TPA: rRNA maturation RNase YbeY [Mariprofundaceae bacterium]|nr:rRNA maturation RNase YbeY [Mariprofundaceae bacterium]
MIDIVVDEDVDMRRMPDMARTAVAVRVTLALAAGFDGKPDLCIRFAGDDAMRRLNRDWRGKDAVTDVLSFPMQEGDIDPAAYLGDIALAVPFVEGEAARLAWPAADHALHLIVHGVLHLLGLDHQDDAEAVRMQALERQAMDRLGLHDPYPEPREERTHVG